MLSHYYCEEPETVCKSHSIINSSHKHIQIPWFGSNESLQVFRVLLERCVFVVLRTWVLFASVEAVLHFGVQKRKLVVQMYPVGIFSR